MCKTRICEVATAIIPIKQGSWTSLVQWLRLHASTARGVGLMPGQGTKILHAMQPKKPPKKQGRNFSSFKKMETST